MEIKSTIDQLRTLMCWHPQSSRLTWKQNNEICPYKFELFFYLHCERPNGYDRQSGLILLILSFLLTEQKLQQATKGSDLNKKR